MRVFLLNSHKNPDHRGRATLFLLDKTIVGESPTPAVWNAISADLAKVRPSHMREFAHNFPKFKGEIEELYHAISTGSAGYNVIQRVTSGRNRYKPYLCQVGYLAKSLNLYTDCFDLV